MLIEDEVFILQGLQNILDWESLGMEVVHAAHNGQEALALWEQEPVDIIVTDINMPVMDGLDFMKKLRETESRARCIILTGYDEFEYARTAITMDVEDYILKPINEEELEEVLRRADDRLSEMDREQAVKMDDKAGWLRFLRGHLEESEMEEYIGLLPEIPGEGSTYAALMKLNLESLKEAKMSDVLLECQHKEQMKVIYLAAGELLLLVYGQASEEACIKLLTDLQDKIESTYGILSFISIGTSFQDYKELTASYEKATNLKKYQLIEGYGSCVAWERMKERGSENPAMDEDLLRKVILKKDREQAVDYVEDLFVSNVKKDASVDDIFQMCIRIAMLLQEIKKEYKLESRNGMRNLTEMIGSIYQADDIFAIKTVFIGEVSEIISYLHEENSQYTPVVKQILSEVQKNYREDMNLKTLAYKFNMNASYLGQIFQKEVGCSFAQYLSNTKNGIAKDLILNTNMRINDIAREVGYPDTSYFYRKFKQCYGVSPASLREMKKY